MSLFTETFSSEPISALPPHMPRKQRSPISRSHCQNFTLTQFYTRDAIMHIVYSCSVHSRSFV